MHHASWCTMHQVCQLGRHQLVNVICLLLVNVKHLTYLV